MEGKLVFCQDGILRLQAEFSPKETIPLAFIQKYLQLKDDPLFLFDFLNHPVVCEEGTTLADILLAIAPWSEFLSRMLGIDIDAYLTEIRKPTELEVDLEWISVSAVTLIATPVVPFDFSSEENFQLFLNREDTLAKGFVFETVMKGYGYITNDKNAYTIDGDIQAIKNLPVIIDPNHYVIDFQSEMSQKRLFNHRFKGVKKFSTHGSFIEAVQDCLLKDFLEGLLKRGLYYPTPEISRIENEKLEILTESFSQISAEETFDSRQLLEVIEDENDSMTAEDYSQKMLDDIMQQEELSDVFGDFIAYIEDKKYEWSQITDACHKDNEFDIRIGKINIATLPQRNLLDTILPTDKKK
ncbi:hypothetical protein [Thorsellia kenyensis]|uniref:Uncharacterized protein n=1 Tax=Thorsellia kenyensis TaxID=1549888 RepID=A0ABV6CBV4_9GAMM